MLNPKSGPRRAKICISAWVSSEVNSQLEAIALAEERSKSFVLEKFLRQGGTHRFNRNGGPGVTHRKSRKARGGARRA